MQQPQTEQPHPWLSLPFYTSLIMGTPIPRGYFNLMGIHREAVVRTSQGDIGGRGFFYGIEEKHRLMTIEERKLLMSFLNPECLSRHSLEMPFRVPPNPFTSQCMVETFYANIRYITYSEPTGDVGVTHLHRFQQIPNDGSEPTQHIKLMLK